MDAQLANSEPPSAEDAARVRVSFSPTHSSRYNWGSRNALPPQLSSISRLLGKLARKHREFPGCAVYIDRLNDLIANEIKEERGAADDYVRALKNFAILVSAVLLDGTAVTLYDQAQMERALAFQDGGPSLAEPSLEQVKARVVELLTQFRDSDESSPPSSDKPTLVAGGRAPVSRPRPVQTRHAPDLDDVLLKLDEIKRNISLPDGAGTFENVVVNPLDVLKVEFQGCDPDRLQALLSRAALNGYLTPIGKGVYLITLTPEPDSGAKRMSKGNDPGDMDCALEEEHVKYRLVLHKAQTALEEERLMLDRARGVKIEEMQRQHERGVRGQCDDFRRQAEEGLDKRRREIKADCDKELASLKQKFEETEAALMSETEARLQKAAAEIEADAEVQLKLIEEQGDQNWEVSRGRIAGELQEKEAAELLPFRLRIEEIKERIALIEKFKAQRKKPIA